MNTTTLPSADAAYWPPLRGRLAVTGLQGATVSDLVYGGLPSRPGASEPSGDAGEGRDLPVTVGPGRERDSSYRPHPYLPSINALDYVQKASAASLLVVGLVMLLVLAALRPRHAFGLVKRGAKHHAGMK